MIFKKLSCGSIIRFDLVAFFNIEYIEDKGYMISAYFDTHVLDVGDRFYETKKEAEVFLDKFIATDFLGWKMHDVTPVALMIKENH